MFRKFDVEIVRTAAPNQLRWLGRGEASKDGLCGNREYTDLRGYKWNTVQNVIDRETELLHQLEQAPDPIELWGQISDEMWDEVEDELPPVDVGVMAAVAALSASRCVPCASCNGGFLGEQHHEEFPLVTFFTYKAWLPLLLDAAQEADAGLDSGYSGSLLVYADDIWKMVAFARALAARKTAINKLKINTP
jgi:hypothetical protein